jgi:hypothetical protein
VTLTLNAFAPADRASEASRAVANGARLSRPESAARAARRAALNLYGKFSQTRQLHGASQGVTGRLRQGGSQGGSRESTISWT